MTLPSGVAALSEGNSRKRVIGGNWKCNGSMGSINELLSRYEIVRNRAAIVGGYQISVEAQALQILSAADSVHEESDTSPLCQSLCAGEASREPMHQLSVRGKPA